MCGCPASEQLAAGRRMPITKCYFFIYITLEFRWWLRTWKVNLLLQESQYFTITLGSDLKGHFGYTIYFFIHMCFAIHSHGYLGAQYFHEATYFLWNTVFTKQTQPMSHQGNWVIRKKVLWISGEAIYFMCPFFPHFALFLKEFFIFNEICHKVKIVESILPTDNLPTGCYENRHR